MTKSDVVVCAKIVCVAFAGLMFRAFICSGQSASKDSALRWEASSLKLVVPLDVQEVPFAFTARNTSQTVVTIKSITPSCGCTSVKLGTNDVEPGKTLEIKGIIKSDFGEDDKTSEILIRTDDEIFRLTVVLEKDLPIKVVPRLVLWHVAESNEPKTMLVHFSGKPRLLFDRVDADKTVVNVHFEQLSSNEEYKLVISPKDTSKLGVYALTIHALDATNHPYDRVVYAAVRPHSPQTISPVNN